MALGKIRKLMICSWRAYTQLITIYDFGMLHLFTVNQCCSLPFPISASITPLVSALLCIHPQLGQECAANRNTKTPDYLTLYVCSL